MQVPAASPPLWAVAPFALYLLLIAALPLVAAHFWDQNRNKLVVAVIASAPVIVYLTTGAPLGLIWLADSAREYVAFMALLLSLFVITGGVHLRGALVGTPRVNTALLAVGVLLANLIGTTGASLLLIRPLLRANRGRQRRVHMVVFLIFLVSNGAGMLTPLGDPPLFLGFLRGVPFFWTMRLIGPWAFVNGSLLVIFAILDTVMLRGEARHPAAPPIQAPARAAEPLRIAGGFNFVWLLGVVLVIYLSGAHAQALGDNAYLHTLLQVAGVLVFAGLSFRLTPRALREANRFSWAPIIEVAVVFLGVFVTMVPALRLLSSQGAALGVTKPWQFFWASGLLSGFLDNAPTYLTFTTLAVAVVNQLTGSHLSAEHLAGLGAHPVGAGLLAAISCGSVLMGALSYIGNGPNFMVKALAEQGPGDGDQEGDGEGEGDGDSKVRMPSFFGYLAWSGGILIPLFVALTFIFF
jgi:Na+/H+ antiporter NhaD/arsenite permease-like protein